MPLAVGLLAVGRFFVGRFFVGRRFVGRLLVGLRVGFLLACRATACIDIAKLVTTFHDLLERACFHTGRQHAEKKSNQWYILQRVLTLRLGVGFFLVGFGVGFLVGFLVGFFVGYTPSRAWSSAAAAVGCAQCTHVVV